MDEAAEIWITSGSTALEERASMALATLSRAIALITILILGFISRSLSTMASILPALPPMNAASGMAFFSG